MDELVIAICCVVGTLLYLSRSFPKQGSGLGNMVQAAAPLSYLRFVND